MEIIKKIVRSVFTVKQKIYITPHYIRIIFNMTDEQAIMFANVRPGDNNKIFIPDPGTNVIVFPDDKGILQAKPSVKRTYTTRHIDYKNNELWIDFVAHGDNGPASCWALLAETGSKLGIAMKQNSRPLFPEADHYILIGDSTALPVISVILEQLPPHVEARVVLEVHGKQDQIDLISKARLHTTWLYNAHPENGSTLAALACREVYPSGKKFVFAAAEYDITKILKGFFRNEKQWNSHEYSVVSYWKKGESEQEFELLRQTDNQ